MRHLQAVGLALALSVLSGCCLCSTWPTSSSPLDPAEQTTVANKPATADAVSPAVVYLDVALIERPIGERYLNHELWAVADEQAIPLEVKPLLEENGLRVARLSGALPDRLQAWLASRSSCPDPRRLQLTPEDPAKVHLGVLWPECRFTWHGSRETRSLAFSQAQCHFQVGAALEEDRKVRLRFQPQIRHGKPRIERQVTTDADGSLRWSVLTSEQIERFETLDWEISLGPQEYIVVGTRVDLADTLGHAFFMPPSDRTRVQKLLLLRVSRSPETPATSESFHRAPPLALQASRTPPLGLE